MARTDASKSAVYVMPANGGPWIPLSTDGHPYVDKPRWSFDSSAVYFLSDRFGVLTVWGRQVDRDTGHPVGASFQVMELEAPDRIIPDRMIGLQTALTRDRLALPLTDVSGAVWVLDDFDR